MSTACGFFLSRSRVCSTVISFTYGRASFTTLRKPGECSISQNVIQSPVRSRVFARRWRFCMDVKNLNQVSSFITRDGSEIRELLAYRNSAIRQQSLAEARLPVGASTQEHYHPKAEEIYFITYGNGRMRIEGETRDVKPGDAIAIPPGQRHKLWNSGN